MKAKELIALLSELPPDAEVVAHDEAMGILMPVTEVDFQPALGTNDIMVDQIALVTEAPTTTITFRPAV